MDRQEYELRESVKTGACLGEEAALPREVYALLAQANLLRVRGHWEEAAQSCMAALRLAPDSSSANSLLGDIYENQGRYADAAQWYRMALDANPDSPADRLKLDRLRQHEKAPQNPSTATGQPPEPLLSLSALSLPSRLHQLIRDPEIVLRYGAIAAALGLILVVACAYAAVRHAGSLSALGVGREAVVKSAPVIVPPLGGALPADPDGLPARDPSEQSLLVLLQASRDLSASGVAVYDVQVDPRTRRTTVTLGLPATAGLTQAQVSRDALRVLQAAAASGQATETFTARGLLAPNAQNNDSALVFVGDASREAVLAVAAARPGLTDMQAEAVFTNIWWSSTAQIRI